MRRAHLRTFGLALTIALATSGCAWITRASVDALPGDANGESVAPAISANGRWVAFTSAAPDLVPGDRNARPDVFVRDTANGTTARVSVDAGGGDADGASWSPAISADGRYVVFGSDASDLVAGDGNGAADVFVRDLQTATTTRVSLDAGGADADAASWEPTISSDGTTVAFVSAATDLVPSDGNDLPDVFVRVLATGATTRASVAVAGEPDGESTGPALSGNGRLVAFASAASNLVAGDANGVPDVFVRNLAAATTERVSVTAGGGEADAESTSPSISADGRRVAFVTAAALVAGDGNGADDVYLRDRTAVTTTLVSVDAGGADADGPSAEPAVSADGTRVAFASAASDLVAGDANGADDVFVRVLSPGATTRWSVDGAAGEADGVSASPTISSNGSRVAFASVATDLVAGDANQVGDVFLRNGTNATTTRLSVDLPGSDPNGASREAAVSATGRHLAFTSDADNLVDGDFNAASDVFVRDVETGATTRASVDAEGLDADGASSEPSISADGRYVAFTSTASDLVPDDGNGVADVFVRDLVAGTTVRVSVDASGADADGPSSEPSISADGGSVAFTSTASDLVPGDGNGVADVFVRDLVAGSTVRVSVDASGADADAASGAPDVSGDGQRVAFASSAADLVAGDGNGVADVFVRDRAPGTTARVSVDTAGGDADAPSATPSITGDGLQVAFASSATDLVAGDGNGVADVFLRDLGTGTTARMSVDAAGGDADAASSAPDVSSDGSAVTYVSAATDLVAGDVGGFADVFVRRLASSSTVRVSAANGGAIATAASDRPALTADGEHVAFESAASNLVPDDRGVAADVFLRAVVVPTVTSVTPSTFSRGDVAQLTITGTGFRAGAAVGGLNGFALGPVTIVSSTLLQVDVVVAPDAKFGTRSVVVSVPGPGPGVDLGYGLCTGCVAVVSPPPRIEPFAGTIRTPGYAGDGGPATAAALRNPSDVVFAPDGTAYIADSSNHAIRRVAPDGTITTYAGGNGAGYSGDGGPAAAARLDEPTGVALGPDDALYVTDRNNSAIRRIDPSGAISTIAGGNGPGLSGDGGPATAAQLNFPRDLTFDPAGNLYFTDRENNAVRRISTSGVITTIAGGNGSGYSGDGGPAAAAQLSHPRGILLDAAGAIVFADYQNDAVRRIALDGTITTIVGGNGSGYSGDGGPAAAAQLHRPSNVALDGAGNLYVSEHENNAVRRVDAGGTITTVVGGRKGFRGDYGPPLDAEMNWPSGLTFDPGGALVIADRRNCAIRRVVWS